jgi:small subunit ribosomal protein S4
MIKSPDCKKCRRVGAKLFLKGEKCDSQKCPMIKKPYSPGEKPKRRKSRVSQYGIELVEKQKLRYWYYIKEKQFVRYIKSVTEKKSGMEGAGDQLLRALEGRLDNFVYRAGFASSRLEAKQLVNHRFFHVNGKPVDVPSYQIKVGDVVSVRDSKKKTKNFVDFKTKMKNFKPPSWISLDKNKIEAKSTGEVVIEDIAPPVEISSIFEFYSR